MTSMCNLDLILLRIELQINKIKAYYITIYIWYTLYLHMVTVALLLQIMN